MIDYISLTENALANQQRAFNKQIITLIHLNFTTCVNSERIVCRIVNEISCSYLHSESRESERKVINFFLNVECCKLEFREFQINQGH